MTAPNQIAEMVRSARISFPKAESDVEALCLRIMQMERHSEERLSLFNTNAKQGQMIAELRRQLAGALSDA